MKVKKSLKSQSVVTVSLEVVVHEPEQTNAVQPLEIVLVHGACHTAACWHQFQEYFAHAGYRSIAFSLRGHGESQGRENVVNNRLWDYVADLEQAVREEVRTPFVLVGHSLGGYIVQSYLSQRELPRPVGGLLLASPTPLQARKLSRDVRTIMRNFRTFLKALLTGNTRMLYTTPEQTRDWFFTSDTPQETVDACFRQLQDESMRASADALRLPSPEKNQVLPLDMPLYFLGADRDTFIPPASIKASATAYGTISTIFPNRGHDLMLDQGWEEVAEQIVQWIKDHVVGA